MTTSLIDFDGQSLKVEEQSDAVRQLIAALDGAQQDSIEARESAQEAAAKAAREIIKCDLYVQALRQEIGRVLLAEKAGAEKAGAENGTPEGV